MATSTTIRAASSTTTTTKAATPDYTSSKLWKIAAAFFVVFVVLFNLQTSPGFQNNKNDDSSRLGSTVRVKTSISNSINGTIIVSSSADGISLVPGELPGYTGWARKEDTLAGNFQIISISPQQPQIGKEFNVSVQCTGHPDCDDDDDDNNNAQFYLRAYGPSVISGLVKKQSNQKGGSYIISYWFHDPGIYTVEVVLTFSNPPNYDNFPLPSEQKEPPYEGYMLPGFPLQVQVATATPTSNNNDDKKKKKDDDERQQHWCTMDHLTVSTPTEAIYNSRWKVVGKSNSPGHILTPQHEHEISEEGYKLGINSLGIQMDYQHNSGCVLLPHNALTTDRGNNDHPFRVQCSKSDLQIVFIGDSTMRIQKAMFDEMIQDIPNIQTHYINLYGGYRRCESFGPNIKDKLEDIKRKRSTNDGEIAILFNSGLHDIHRLCGREFERERYDYINKDKLDNGTFSCTEEYRSIIQDFATLITSFPADLRVFQTTTSGWPKYGNFGIEWKTSSKHGECLPLAPDIVAHFNGIAFEVMQDFRDKISIVDGYWITHARPDNREIGPIGSKLSHPGLEVQSAMVRIWAMLCLQKACKA